MKRSLFTFHFSLLTCKALSTLLFFVAVLLFFGLVYPHHLHYQEQYQLFLFDSNYVWEIVRLPGGTADLLGRFCTQFFLYAWVGALIIAILLSVVQLLTLRLLALLPPSSFLLPPYFLPLSFVPSFLLWLFLLDENALLGGVWAALLILLTFWICVSLPYRWMRGAMIIVAIPALYWMVSPFGHYYRNPAETPWLLWAAVLSIIVMLMVNGARSKRILLPPIPADAPTRSLSSFLLPPVPFLLPPSSFLLISALMGTLVWKNSNFKAEKVMGYDFMARHQQWNRILETINAEKPNNQIGVTVQNLALGMHGLLIDHLFDYNQNGLLGLLPDVGTDAVSPLPTAEAFYQLGMINIAHRTVFEAQEAILDFQKSGRCYKRLAQTNLITGSYEVARKYLSALQKTLFYKEWADETLPLLGDEEAIAKHPEYGRLRRMTYDKDFYFGDHVTPEMLEDLCLKNEDNRLAYQYLVAYYMLTGDRDGYTNFLRKTSTKQ